VEAKLRKLMAERSTGSTLPAGSVEQKVERDDEEQVQLQRYKAQLVELKDRLVYLEEREARKLSLASTMNGERDSGAASSSGIVGSRPRVVGLRRGCHESSTPVEVRRTGAWGTPFTSCLRRLVVPLGIFAYKTYARRTCDGSW
jgi:hypothetical protein